MQIESCAYVVNVDIGSAPLTTDESHRASGTVLLGSLVMDINKSKTLRLEAHIS